MADVTSTLLKHRRRLNEIAGALSRHGLAAWAARGGGITAFTPFLDKELITFCMRIPVKLKINPERTFHGKAQGDVDDTRVYKKLILREAARRLGLPEPIAFRPTHPARNGGVPLTGPSRPPSWCRRPHPLLPTKPSGPVTKARKGPRPSCPGRGPLLPGSAKPVAKPG